MQCDCASCLNFLQFVCQSSKHRNRHGQSILFEKKTGISISYNHDRNRTGKIGLERDSNSDRNQVEIKNSFNRNGAKEIDGEQKEWLRLRLVWEVSGLLTVLREELYSTISFFLLPLMLFYPKSRNRLLSLSICLTKGSMTAVICRANLSDVAVVSYEMF